MQNPLFEAFRLIFSLDSELVNVIWLSLRVSATALLLGVIIGLPLAAILAVSRFPLRSFLITLVNAFMGLPPVVVGLFLYILLSRKGLFGSLGLLYTPWAMIAAQTVIAVPIIIGLGHSAIAGVDSSVRLAAMSLGASRVQLFFKIIIEARYGIMAAVVAAFGRLTAEVGAIIIVGGNIAGLTRVMTTSIALETDKGNFELATALGLILILITFIVNMFLHSIQKRGMRI